MKPDSSFSRYTILWIVLICYLLPVITLSAYSTATDGWNVLSLGLLLTAVGALIIFWMMVRLEAKWRSIKTVENIPSESLHQFTPSQSLPEQIQEPIDVKPTVTLQEHEEVKQLNQQQIGEIENLRIQLESVHDKIHQTSLDKEDTAKQLQQSLAEIEEYKKNTYIQLEQQQSHIQELQETIADQRAFIDKKQQQTGLLEGKVGDLTYEIKTLLQLAEAHSGSLYSDPSAPTYSSSFMPEYQYEEPLNIIPEKQIRSHEEATLQLKRCIDIAQKITGSQRFTNQLNAFRDSAADSFALDLRRLCDSLRSENNSTVLLYSPKENQLLFVNNQIKILTGWSPDKFVQNFSDIIQDEDAWRQGFGSLALRSEAQFKIPFKIKSGQDITVQVHMGMIPTGIFRHHAIAILYNPSPTKS